MEDVVEYKGKKYKRIQTPGAFCISEERRCAFLRDGPILHTSYCTNAVDAGPTCAEAFPLPDGGNKLQFSIFEELPE